MPVIIDTPIPSIQEVARMMGVSRKRVKEIQQLIDELPSRKRVARAASAANVAMERSRKVRRSAKPRSAKRG